METMERRRRGIRRGGPRATRLRPRGEMLRRTCPKAYKTVNDNLHVRRFGCSSAWCPPHENRGPDPRPSVMDPDTNR